MTAKSANFISFMVFVVTWTFLVAATTGVVLYIAPQGRVANSIDWRLLGLAKQEWRNLHLVFTALFIVGGVLHLYSNWRLFKKFLTEKVTGHLHIKKEPVISLTLCILIILATITQTPPLNYYFQFHEWVKQSWTDGSIDGQSRVVDEVLSSRPNNQQGAGENQQGTKKGKSVE